ncbi:hypothetical protein LTR62_006350 [Meristemomyces frigidus]|uniref:GH16 domain-containing protein n=1 Tax=Meristemomyces frigidus TaxID=1508187 RepID=A0AAN7TCL1_9PEZI|nr:hypothetical protein LTR62_006350 [Meristemomyces frigidus]
MTPILVAFLLTIHVSNGQYVLQSSFPGADFLDNFEFWTSADPTIGYVHYVDQTTAQQHGMVDITSTSTSWGVDTTQILDPNANLGRLSIRLTSLQSWTHGLFVLDLEHMPANQCGTWPAFWSVGSGTWPAGGEIDIIEYSNTLPNNLMALHTSETTDCTIAGSGQSGTLLTSNCSGGFTGCSVAADIPNNIGNDFSAASGGVYAMEWTSTAIQIWFFPRNAIPASLLNAPAEAVPDPTTFGVPMAKFQGSCDIDSHFYNHRLVFDIDFCGSYAGNTWEEEGCPMLNATNGWQSCNDYVAANPQDFTEAYWQINYLDVYQQAGLASSSSSPLVSVTPAIKTSSVSTALSAAQGQSTTPSGTPFLVTASLISGSLSWPPASRDSSSLPAFSSSPASSSTFSTGVTQTSAAIPSTVSFASVSASLATAQSTSPALTTLAPLAATTAIVVVYQTVTVTAPADSRLKPQLGPSDEEYGIVGRNELVPIRPVPVVDVKSYTATLGHLPSGAHLPFIGPAGMMPEPLRADKDDRLLFADHRYHEVVMPEAKRVREPQTLGGGGINFCGVPGSACLEVIVDGETIVIIKSTPTATESAAKRAAAPQSMVGGGINFCGVPGSGCSGVRFQDDEMATSTGSRLNVPPEPTITMFPEAEPGVYATGAVVAPPAVATVAKPSTGQSKRTAPDYVWASPDSSYDLDFERDSPHPTSTGGINFQQTSPSRTMRKTHPRTMKSATCTPVVVVSPNGVPVVTSCHLPPNIQVTKSEPIVHAGTTRFITLRVDTAVAFTTSSPRLLGPLYQRVENVAPPSSVQIASTCAAIMVVGMVVATFLL